MNCPLCLSTLQQKAIDRILNPRKIGAPKYSYLKCNVCELWTLYPPPAEDELRQIYNAQYSLYEGGKTFVSRLIGLITPSRESVVSKFIKPHSTILDVGCGTGTFLLNMQKKGHNVIGTEWNLAAAHKAALKIGRNNVLTSVKQYKNSGKKFNLITLFHVLEHNPKPIELITELIEYLASGGYIAIEVPNSKAKLLQRHGEKYPWLSIPEHVTYWNTKSLSQLLSSFSLRRIYTSTPFAMPFLRYKTTKKYRDLFISPLSQLLAAQNGEGDILREVWKMP